MKSEDIISIPRSKIGDIGRLAYEHPDVANLAFGESDFPPPERARAALIDAVSALDTRYVDSRGRLSLRQDIARYLSRLHRFPVEEDRILVMASGMAAISVAFASVLRAGDRVVIHEPEWPNLAAAALARGASVTRVALDVDGAGGFRLNLEKLEAVLSNARVFCLNSPNNPTGWMATAEEIAAILDLCRRHRVWLISDEVYSRLTYDGAEAAPSLLDVASPRDRVMIANSVSKTWAMTGFRVGWLVVPEGTRDTIGELTEATHSSVAPFSQEAARAALADKKFVNDFRSFCATGRAVTSAALTDLGRVKYRLPMGGFYLFIQVEGIQDSLELARYLAVKHKIAVAPGIAFGAAGEGYLRLCFAQRESMLTVAMDRLRTGLESLA